MSDSYIWTLDKHKHNTLRKTKYEIIVNTLDCKKLNDTIPSLAKKKPEFNGLMRPFNICVSRIHQTFAKLIQPSWNLDGKLDQQLAVRLFFFFFSKANFPFCPGIFLLGCFFRFRFPFSVFFFLFACRYNSLFIHSPVINILQPYTFIMKDKNKTKNSEKQTPSHNAQMFFFLSLFLWFSSSIWVTRSEVSSSPSKSWYLLLVFLESLGYQDDGVDVVCNMYATEYLFSS